MDLPTDVPLQKPEEMAAYWYKMTGRFASAHHAPDLISSLIAESGKSMQRRRILVIGSLYLVGDTLGVLKYRVP
jgi:folylpolyglutamate synthase/dihydropteroate synthase